MSPLSAATQPEPPPPQEPDAPDARPHEHGSMNDADAALAVAARAYPSPSGGFMPPPDESAPWALLPVPASRKVTKALPTSSLSHTTAHSTSHAQPQNEQMSSHPLDGSHSPRDHSSDCDTSDKAPTCTFLPSSVSPPPDVQSVPGAQDTEGGPYLAHSAPSRAKAQLSPSLGPTWGKGLREDSTPVSGQASRTRSGSLCQSPLVQSLQPQFPLVSSPASPHPVAVCATASLTSPGATLSPPSPTSPTREQRGKIPTGSQPSEEPMGKPAHGPGEAVVSSPVLVPVLPGSKLGTKEALADQITLSSDTALGAGDPDPDPDPDSDLDPDPDPDPTGEVVLRVRDYAFEVHDPRHVGEPDANMLAALALQAEMERLEQLEIERNYAEPDPSEPSLAMGEYEVLYAFQAESGNEVSCGVGEHVFVVGAIDGGWAIVEKFASSFEGEIVRGLVPESYLGWVDPTPTPVNSGVARAACTECAHVVSAKA